MEWYSINNVGEIDTPALVLYPERIKSNLRLAISMLPDSRRLMPHVKTNKCAHVIRMMLAEGITRFKCATIAEAEMLATEGATEVLLAYQPLGPKAKRFCQLQRKFPKTAFSCLIDHRQSLLKLSECARQAQQTAGVFLDLNTGMNRTGMAPGKEALDLYQLATDTPGIEIKGLHAYDGHLHDRDFSVRERKCNQAFEGVEKLRNEIEKRIGQAIMVVAGGTPTFPIHAKRADVVCSPGTFVFWDSGYQQIMEELPFAFAALVLTRVISAPGAENICVDLGHKSIASENPIENRVNFLNAPGLKPLGHSEEHMVLRADINHKLQPGDVLYGVPYHICPTVALYDEASVCVDHRIGETWPIAGRTRKITV